MPISSPRESALVGPAEHFDIAESEPGVAMLHPGKGTPAEEVELLGATRNADRNEPLWSGVSDLRAQDGKVRVQFARRYEPYLLPIADSSVQVSCHRYHDPRQRSEPSRPRRRPVLALGCRSLPLPHPRCYWYRVTKIQA